MDIFDMLEDLKVEEEAMMLSESSRKVRVVRNRPDHFNQWDDKEFHRRFRLHKKTVQHLCSLIEHKIKHNTKRNQAVPPMKQLLISLRFYAPGSFYIVVGDFGGIHVSTVGKIVKRVTDAIASLCRQFIHLPQLHEISKIQEEFYEIARFPRVIAALDCTHVRITSPGGETAENFRNRKGYFSINVQAMCDANLKFCDIVARWPGSSHDSNIFLNSAAKYKFDNHFFDNGIILGDNGYFQNDYLLTPYTDPDTEEKRLYNESHIRTRNVIERCFGVWKRRFPVLSIGMRCRLPLVQDVIVATAVLHNMAIAMNDTVPPEDPEVHVPQHEPFENEIPWIENSGNTRETLLDYFGSLLMA